MHHHSDQIHDGRRLAILAVFAASLASFGLGAGVSALVLRRKLKTALAGYDEACRCLDSTAILRHDYRKHLNMIRRMLTDGQTERALAYLDILSNKAERAFQAVTTGNYMLDLILNSRLAAAREDGLRISVKAAGVPETLHISDDALSALLCNAIDNAVTAARETGNNNGWIDIELYRKGQMLCIGISNSCAGTAAAPSYPMRRKGHGQLIMRNIVDHYHGVMEAESNDGNYRLSLLLPVIG